MTTSSTSEAGIVECAGCETAFSGRQERLGCWLLVPGVNHEDRETVWVCPDCDDRSICAFLDDR